jgi:hypothetical protein
MTDIDLAAAGIEICNRTGIDTANPLSDKEKAIMLKGISGRMGAVRKGHRSAKSLFAREKR